MKIEHIAMYVNDLEKARDFSRNTSEGNQTTAITMCKQYPVSRIHTSLVCICNRLRTMIF